MSGSFELYRDVRERFRFRLKSDGGEIILTSDGFDRKTLALDIIVSIMKSASEAVIVDLTPQENRAFEREAVQFLDSEDSFSEFDDQFSGKKKKRRKRKGKKEKKSDRDSNNGKGKKSKKKKKKK